MSSTTAPKPVPIEQEEPENQYKVWVNGGEKNEHHPRNIISTGKYTVWNFVPKNLMEQLRRLSNIYFLLTAVFAAIPGVSPVIPVTSISPFVFVIAVSAIKDGYEDYMRHQADNATNTRLYDVTRKDENGNIETVQIESQNLCVGDVLRVNKLQQFPADMLLLSSSYETGECYVETSNLDG
eukprot:TRINITY_DN2458_c0_g1_i3.p1 TRINITY_DN2458_c0_g1~~TRINITY_DN2458_c0_g1_i3.p1  ORF type:complete len:195 (-),score=44.74 TRINITY_DN2458_c0_g1_i3:876-1418(-)